ncbi:PTS lactose/cellobiose transporter subunit IIA [Enterococcus faecium]|uniref:PTS lactose/cellobiose transporter subunit IIA n=1 Tax=Enterococcus faecium TaxID=1352 RepID=UPI0039ECA3AB
MEFREGAFDFQTSQQNHFDNVERLLADADENLTLAHNSQTKCLAEEASGNEMEVGVIFIHGQDHLMTTILLRELINDFVELYKEKFAKA